MIISPFGELYLNIKLHLLASNVKQEIYKVPEHLALLLLLVGHRAEKMHEHEKAFADRVLGTATSHK